jgi:hypothetical protein
LQRETLMREREVLLKQVTLTPCNPPRHPRTQHARVDL